MPRPFQQLPFAALPETPRVPHRFFELPGREVVVGSSAFGRVRVQLRELGEGEPLLLVHGLMTTGYSYRYVVHALARTYRVIVPDLVGAGRSDKPRGRYDPDSLARFLGALIDALGIRGAPVVANSLGGHLAMRLALEDPGAMRALVGVHPPAFPDVRVRALRLGLAVPGAQALLERVIARDPERWAHRHVHYRDETLKSREEAREYGAPLSTPEGRGAFVAWLRDALEPARMRAFAQGLRARGRFPIPLLLLYAREDPMVPPEVGARLHALLPESELVWLKDASHFAQVDQPQALLDATLPFLARGA